MRVALRVSVLAIMTSLGWWSVPPGGAVAADRTERAAARRAGLGGSAPGNEVVVEPRGEAELGAGLGRGLAAKRTTLAQKRRDASRALSESLDAPHGMTLSSRPTPPRDFAYGPPGYKASPVYSTTEAPSLASESRLRHVPSPSGVSNTSRRSALVNPPQAADRAEITAVEEPSLVPAPGGAKPIAPRAAAQRGGLR